MDTKIDHRIRVGAHRRHEMQVRLLFSGLVLASKKSIHEIDVEDVIEQADVSRGTFYKYFPSVRALFRELSLQLAEEIAIDYDLIALQMPDPLLRLSCITRGVMRLTVDIPLIGKLAIQNEWPSDNFELSILSGLAKDLELCIESNKVDKASLSIGMGLIGGSIRSGIFHMLKNAPCTGYEDMVMYHILIGLGVAKETAEIVSKLPIPQPPPFPQDGVLAKIEELVNLPKNE